MRKYQKCPQLVHAKCPRIDLAGHKIIGEMGELNGRNGHKSRTKTVIKGHFGLFIHKIDESEEHIRGQLQQECALLYIDCRYFL
jgi:hypothetical protein